MTRRVKRDNRTGETKLDPKHELTEREAAEYAQSVHDFHIPISKLQRSRIGRCSGPKYLKIDGWGVRYTPQFIDEYIQSRRSHVVVRTKAVALMIKRVQVATTTMGIRPFLAMEIRMQRSLGTETESQAIYRLKTGTCPRKIATLRARSTHLSIGSAECASTMMAQ